MIEYKQLSDAELLSAVIGELDQGWTQGRMCSKDGRKCLVGAGAAVLNPSYINDTHLLWDWRTSPTAERMSPEEYRALASRLVYSEEFAAERLAKILGLEFDDEIHDDWMEVVTTFNDNIELSNHTDDDCDEFGYVQSKFETETYLSFLRPRLVAKLEELQGGV